MLVKDLKFGELSSHTALTCIRHHTSPYASIRQHLKRLLVASKVPYQSLSRALIER